MWGVGRGGVGGEGQVSMQSEGGVGERVGECAGVELGGSGRVRGG